MLAPQHTPGSGDGVTYDLEAIEALLASHPLSTWEAVAGWAAAGLAAVGVRSYADAAAAPAPPPRGHRVEGDLQSKRPARRHREGRRGGAAASRLRGIAAGQPQGKEHEAPTLLQAIGTSDGRTLTPNEELREACRLFAQMKEKFGRSMRGRGRSGPPGPAGYTTAAAGEPPAPPGYTAAGPSGATAPVMIEDDISGVHSVGDSELGTAVGQQQQFPEQTDDAGGDLVDRSGAEVSGGSETLPYPAATGVAGGGWSAGVGGARDRSDCSESFGVSSEHSISAAVLGEAALTRSTKAATWMYESGPAGAATAAASTAATTTAAAAAATEGAWWGGLNLMTRRGGRGASASKRPFTCYDAAMSALLEAAWRQGPAGAAVHVTSRAPGAAPSGAAPSAAAPSAAAAAAAAAAASAAAAAAAAPGSPAIDAAAVEGDELAFEFIIDLGAMVQTSVLTGEARRVVRHEMERPDSSSHPYPGGRPPSMAPSPAIKEGGSREGGARHDHSHGHGLPRLTPAVSVVYARAAPGCGAVGRALRCLFGVGWLVVSWPLALLASLYPFHVLLFVRDGYMHVSERCRRRRRIATAAAALGKPPRAGTDGAADAGAGADGAEAAAGGGEVELTDIEVASARRNPNAKAAAATVVPRVIEVVRGPSYGATAMGAAMRSSGDVVATAAAGADAPIAPTVPTVPEIPTFTDAQLRRMGEEEALQMVLRATAAQAEALERQRTAALAQQRQSSASASALLHGGRSSQLLVSDTVGKVNQRRRQLLAEAMPGFEQREAQLVFSTNGGTTLVPAATPGGAWRPGGGGGGGDDDDDFEGDDTHCIVCQGTGKVSSLLTAPQAVAAGCRSVTDMDRFLCGICFGDGAHLPPSSTPLL